MIDIPYPLLNKIVYKEINIDNKLLSKYFLLDKYGFLEKIDNVIWGNGKLDNLLSKIRLSENNLEEEFFNGTSINEMDMLMGDISELAPIIYDRIRIRSDYENIPVYTIFEQIVTSKEFRDLLYNNYFNYIEGENI